MTVKIQKTVVTDNRIEMFIADNADPFKATVSVSFAVRATVQEVDLLGVIELTALKKLRGIISDELSRLSRAGFSTPNPQDH